MGRPSTKDQRRLGLRRFRDARDAAHRGMARLFARAQVNAEEIQHHRILMKRYGRARPFGLRAILAAAEGMEALADHYAHRLRDDPEPRKEERVTVRMHVPDEDDDPDSEEWLEVDERSEERSATGVSEEETDTEEDLLAWMDEELDDDREEPRQEPVTVDSLRPEELEEVARRYHLVCRMRAGMPTKKALQLCKFNRSERWARNLRQRFETLGMPGLLDGRRRNTNHNEVLIPQVKRVILKWWVGRPVAPLTKIQELAAKECQAKGLPVPSYPTVYAYIESLPEPFKLFRQGRIAEWDKQGRPVVRFQLAKYANHRWQLDHTMLDLWIRMLTKLGWVARRVWCTVAIDAFSRSVAGLVISTKHPDSWTSSLLMYQAIQEKTHPEWLNRGLPTVVQTDCGKDFLSYNTQALFADLKIEADTDPPRYPNRKGICERFFLTLDGFLRTLPGHKAEIGTLESSAEKHLHILLTRNQLREAIEDWVATDYHRKRHSGLDGACPEEVWQQQVRLRMPESTDQLNVLLLQSDELRVVQRTGIRFQHQHYWAPDLTDYWKRGVRLRYHPEDDESVLVYDDVNGEFIVEAFVMGRQDSRYTIQDVKKARSQYRRGLLERMKLYRREVEDEDRRMAREETWKAAQAQAAELAEEDPSTLPDDAELDELEDLMDEMERWDRGED